MKKDLTIVIVTHNSEKIIPICISKLDLERYDLTVVDNGSSDNTLSVIKKEFSHCKNLKIIELDKNLGFARANNFALNQINTKFSLILNPDAFIDTKDIEKVLSVMKQNDNIALAGCPVCSAKINDKVHYEIIDCEKIKYLSDEGDFYKTRFVTGAGMFMNMDIFKKIGFFDEGFFLYCEDNEICKRTLKKRYDIALVKDTQLLHMSQKSCQNRDEKKYLILWCKFGWSKMYYTEKVHGKFIAKLKAIRSVLKSLVLIFFDLLKSRKVSLHHKAVLSASLSYFFGGKAFDKNDNPRSSIF